MRRPLVKSFVCENRIGIRIESKPGKGEMRLIFRACGQSVNLMAGDVKRRSLRVLRREKGFQAEVRHATEECRSMEGAWVRFAYHATRNFSITTVALGSGVNRTLERSRGWHPAGSPNGISPVPESRVWAVRSWAFRPVT